MDEGYTDVIHIPINRSGSSTYDNAVMAQNLLREERPEHHLNIHLLDPHTYSMVLWLVYLRDGTQAAQRRCRRLRTGAVDGDMDHIGVTLIHILACYSQNCSGVMAAVDGTPLA